MHRISIGNTGTWFGRDAATRYGESTHWDGHNRISDATGSQWDHQELYRTAKGRWVLHVWSQWQGSGETYEIITPDEAYNWLVCNGHSEELNSAALEAREV